MDSCLPALGALIEWLVTRPAELPPDLREWLAARRRFRLSDLQVQMARELGLNPRKLGKIANHDQEPWKAPLPEFLEETYRKRFKRERPEKVRSLEEIGKARWAGELATKTRKPRPPAAQAGRGRGRAVGLTRGA